MWTYLVHLGVRTARDIMTHHFSKEAEEQSLTLLLPSGTAPQCTGFLSWVYWAGLWGRPEPQRQPSLLQLLLHHCLAHSAATNTNITHLNVGGPVSVLTKAIQYMKNTWISELYEETVSNSLLQQHEWEHLPRWWGSADLKHLSPLVGSISASSDHHMQTLMTRVQIYLQSR